MLGPPVDLDDRRLDAAQIATAIRRRRLDDRHGDPSADHNRQIDLEDRLLRTTPAETWSEAVAHACYLLDLFASTQAGQRGRRGALIARTIDDLARLCPRDP